MLEHLLTIWSIRLALLLFAMAVIARPRRRGRAVVRGLGWRVPRALWVAGLLLSVVHVIAVFGYLMDWSHQAALDDTARKTRRLVGVSFAGGVYFNYVFLAVWMGDAVWWCGWPARYLRRAWLWDALVIGYLGFIAFNATVIFESGVIRWLGLVAALAVVWAEFRQMSAGNRLP